MYSENKGTDQLRSLVLAYADCWFSHDAAHLDLIVSDGIPNS